LRLHGVLAGTVKLLDPQVLLDPLEEQLDLPTRLVDAGDGQRREREIVGQKLESLVRLGVKVADPPQRVRIRQGRLDGSQ